MKSWWLLILAGVGAYLLLKKKEIPNSCQGFLGTNEQLLAFHMNLVASEAAKRNVKPTVTCSGNSITLTWTCSSGAGTHTYTSWNALQSAVTDGSAWSV